MKKTSSKKNTIKGRKINDFFTAQRYLVHTKKAKKLGDKVPVNRSNFADKWDEKTHANLITAAKLTGRISGLFVNLKDLPVLKRGRPRKVEEKPVTQKHPAKKLAKTPKNGPALKNAAPVNVDAMENTPAVLPAPVAEPVNVDKTIQE